MRVSLGGRIIEVLVLLLRGSRRSADRAALLQRPEVRRFLEELARRPTDLHARARIADTGLTDDHSALSTPANPPARVAASAAGDRRPDRNPTVVVVVFHGDGRGGNDDPPEYWITSTSLGTGQELEDYSELEEAMLEGVRSCGLDGATVATLADATAKSGPAGVIVSAR